MGFVGRTAELASLRKRLNRIASIDRSGVDVLWEPADVIAAWGTIR